MISISLAELATIVEGSYEQVRPSLSVANIAIDSRQILPESLFVALKGQRTDGHAFVAQALKNGATAALVSREFSLPERNEALIRVENPLRALQKLAGWYRRTHLKQVVAITGSNGKTLVKDALASLLSDRFLVSASPGSFNSGLGVPLSVLAASPESEICVFEAGVSEPGDMDPLVEILKPDYVLLTNVGMAHLAAFGTQEQTAAEKCKLVRAVPAQGWALLPESDGRISRQLDQVKPSCSLYYLGSDAAKLVSMTTGTSSGLGNSLIFHFPDGQKHKVLVETRAPELWTDLHFAVCAAYLLGIEPARIAALLEGYRFGPTRMEIWCSPEGVTILNDAYSSDPISVKAAMEAAVSLAGNAGQKIFVFGGMRELGNLAVQEHAYIGEIAAKMGFSQLITVGSGPLEETRKAFLAANPEGHALACTDPSQLQAQLRPFLKPGDTLLFKGPRLAGIANAAQALTDSIAPNRLLVDLGAIGENIRRFRRHCGPHVKLLAMVKAVAYGSNLGRLPSWLQQAGVDYFGVSTPDEGAELRRAGVRAPILVILTTLEETDKILRYRLTPAVYSLDLARRLGEASAFAQRCVEVHIKLDTGMGRLGVHLHQLPELVKTLDAYPTIKITGVMSHFACADDPSKDGFNHAQIAAFRAACAQLEALGHGQLLRHISSSAGMARFPEAHFDMVRVGLMLYGIQPSPATATHLGLRLALSLVSRIAHISLHQPGDCIGYGATYEIGKEGARIGIVPIGYNDGVPWSLGNKGYVLIEGQRAPIAGRLSMDSLAIDLSEIPQAEVGSEVVLFGERKDLSLRPEEVAALAGTIPYEIITRISHRVQRIYLGE